MIRAPRGMQITCKGWIQEAAMRMLMNNLDPDVAELPEQLIVYGGSGKAARNWDCYHAMINCLQRLENDETLLVQSGKPVAIFRTHSHAPRVLISNSMLVPAWATWENFRELEHAGLTMYGQMTAGSWIYIGTQGILQGTFETFAAAAQKHFHGELAGKLVVTAGLGGMGGAQPLAATMNGAALLAAEVDEKRIRRRLETGYLDEYTHDLNHAIDLAMNAKHHRLPRSIAWLGNAADLLAELVRRKLVPDLVTDQTSAHDELNGYVPAGMTYENALELRKSNPQDYIRLSYQTIAAHVRAMLDLQRMGSIVFDYGNNIRAQAQKSGVDNAFDFQGFVPLYIRPLFCEGKGPFRWVALSGDPADIARTDEMVLELFPENKALAKWLRMASAKVHFQGLPARICWLGYKDRAKFGLAINRAIARREIKAPIVIGRDHLDTGSVASPNRETEGMRDGSDAIADWPILNALLNTASGASWVSVHHGGGVGIGYSLHAGQVIVADGTEEAALRLECVLNNDPGIGVARHADAGYAEAIATAKQHSMQLPMIP